MTSGQSSGGIYSAGRDTFGWARADVVTASGTSAGFDRITDFGAGDRLDLSGLFQAVSGPPVQMIRLADTTAGTIVSADVGASNLIDIVLLEGVHGLDIHDLVTSGSVIL